MSQPIYDTQGNHWRRITSEMQQVARRLHNTPIHCDQQACPNLASYYRRGSNDTRCELHFTRSLTPSEP